LRKAIPDWDARIEREGAARLEAKETKRGNPTGNNQHQRKEEIGNFPVSTSQVVRAESNGISDRTQRKLDRLAKERPDLLERVKAGELKINRAAIEAGIVKSPTKLDKAQPPESPVSAG